MLEKERSKRERREYLRLDTVFPVQFRMESYDGKIFFTGWMQGFTSDVGRGGLGLRVNNFTPDETKRLKQPGTKVSLEISVPFVSRPLRARATVAWVHDAEGESDKYLIGLKYDQIDPVQNRKIMRYAWAKKLFAPVALFSIMLLGIALAFGLYFNMRLDEGNRALVRDLIRVSRESNIAREKLAEISAEKSALDAKLASLGERIRSVEEKRMQPGAEAEKLSVLDAAVLRLNREKDELLAQLEALKGREKIISEEASALTEERAKLEKENFQKLYGWLMVHQNPRTGLVMSFEGDGDISDWAFTYDQSLVAQAYAYFEDFDRARKILEFYAHRARRERGLFSNAYYVNDGTPAEYTLHTGPNIWIGIAALQYAQKSRDPSFVGLAEDIAKSIISIQDKEGGVPGGPDTGWYSTEHNLDAYAFFNMLYRVTGKESYARSRDRILEWLKKHTYDKSDMPVKRGKGDSTIATDTYAWSIAALGPQRLKEIGMDPDKIIEFAEDNCAVTAIFNRPDGRNVRIRGFDFAAKRHLARGWVVSSEWTAQMVISFKIMADYQDSLGNKNKAVKYSAKADDYLLSLLDMIVTSPSPSGQGGNCLPYATQENVDTGHGWMTPKGKTTGSLAGTAYTIFAFYNYNPLKLQD
jgi:hypothetical protein